MYKIYSGLLAPVIFTGSVMFAAHLQDGYSHYHSYVSELAATGNPLAYIMRIGGFYLNSLLLLIFSVTLPKTMPYEGSLKNWATIFFVIHAASMNASGMFSCDLGCIPEAPSVEQQLHDVVGGIGMLSIFISILLWARVFKKIEYKNLAIYSEITAAICSIAFLMIPQSLEERAATGIYQRIALFVAYAWVFVIAANRISYMHFSESSKTHDIKTIRPCNEQPL